VRETEYSAILIECRILLTLKFRDATKHPHIPGDDAHAPVVMRESAVEANQKPVFATVLWGCTMILKVLIYVGNDCCLG
jgi:hypothetical protein